MYLNYLDIIKNNTFCYTSPVYLMHRNDDYHYIKKFDNLISFVNKEIEKIVNNCLFEINYCIGSKKVCFLNLFFTRFANTFLNDWNDKRDNKDNYITDDLNRFYSLYSLKKEIVDYLQYKYKDIKDFDEFYSLIKKEFNFNDYLSEKINIYKYGEVLEIKNFYDKKLYTFRYRIDSVPCISKNKNCHHFRRMKTFNEKKQNSDPTIQKFIRRKRVIIPDSYDDKRISSRDDISWKNCVKVRKQWQKNRKGDIYV